MSDTLATEYADSLIAGIIADLEAGTPFGTNEDTGEELHAYDYLDETLAELFDTL